MDNTVQLMRNIHSTKSFPNGITPATLPDSLPIFQKLNTDKI